MAKSNAAEAMSQPEPKNHEEASVEDAKTAKGILGKTEAELLDSFNEMMEKANEKGGALGERMKKVALSSPEAKRLREMEEERKKNEETELRKLEESKKTKSNLARLRKELKDVKQKRAATDSNEEAPKDRPGTELIDSSSEESPENSEEDEDLTVAEIKEMSAGYEKTPTPDNSAARHGQEEAHADDESPLDIDIEELAVNGELAKELDTLKAEGRLPESFNPQTYLLTEAKYEHAQKGYDEAMSKGFFSRLKNRKQIKRWKSDMEEHEKMASEGRELIPAARERKASGRPAAVSAEFSVPEEKSPLEMKEDRLEALSVKIGEEEEFPAAEKASKLDTMRDDIKKLQEEVDELSRIDALERAGTADVDELVDYLPQGFREKYGKASRRKNIIEQTLALRPHRSTLYRVMVGPTLTWMLDKNKEEHARPWWEKRKLKKELRALAEELSVMSEDIISARARKDSGEAPASPVELSIPEEQTPLQAKRAEMEALSVKISEEEEGGNYPPAEKASKLKKMRKKMAKLQKEVDELNR